MGFFGNSNDGNIEEEVEKATSEKDVEEDWGVIINICDKAGKSTEEAKTYLRTIVKRLYNSDPHIGIKAVTLLDACVKNCGKPFHVEVASREFETDFIKLMSKAPPTVARKLRESLKKWAENEFKADPQLNLIPSLYSKLKNQYDFSLPESPVKKAAPLSKDPNVVESQEEEEQILKAIELSLKETSGSPRATSMATTSRPSTNAPASLYPSVNMASGTVTPSAVKEQRKVRALYDFEAAEDNELTFTTGEIILIIDDSDPNWWKGSNHRGEGLFPANFVTADLSVEPEKFLFEKAKKMVQFKDSNEPKPVEKEPIEIEINEDKIDRLLHLLHEADPTTSEKDTQELQLLEGEVIGMGPLIDTELERVDRKHAQLTQLSADLVEALGLYHTLMREPQYPTLSKSMYDYASMNTMTHNGVVPPGMPSQHQSLSHHPSMMGNPNMMGPPSSMGMPIQHDGRPIPQQQQHYLPPGHQQGLPPSVHQSMPSMTHGQQPTSMAHGQPSLAHSQAGMGVGGQQNIPIMSGPISSVTAGSVQMGPPGFQGLPPHIQQQILEEQQRRQQEHQQGQQQQSMGQYIGMQSYPPPGMPVSFPTTGLPPNQPSLNGSSQQQTPHYVTSSTHMMH